MQRLEILRNSLGLKPSGMASALGLEYQAYYQYEKGHRGIPSEVLSLLATWGVNLNWMAGSDSETMLRPGVRLTVSTDSAGKFQVHKSVDVALHVSEGGSTYSAATKRESETNPGASSWLKAVEDVTHALIQRGLAENVTPLQKETLVDILVRGVAAGAKPDELRWQLSRLVDLVELSMRPKEPG